jgi:hypothetical protein
MPALHGSNAGSNPVVGRQTDTDTSDTVLAVNAGR